MVPTETDHPLNRNLRLNPADGSAPSGLAGPPLTLLDVPSVDSPWRYARAHARSVLAGLIGRQPLRLQAGGSCSAAVSVSPRLSHRWRALFDVPARAATAVPLLTHQSVSTLLHARLVADLGIKLRDLLHLQHRSSHPAGVAAFVRTREQRLSCTVQRVLRLGEDRVLVEVRTLVSAADGRLVATVEDGFLVSHLPPAALAGLPSDRLLLRDLLGLRRRLPRLSITEGDARVAAMPVPHDMGLAYGRISGDIHLARCCRLGAWLSGLKRPVLQGLALRNLVVRHGAELGLPLDGVQLTFASPAYLGQQLLLVALGGDIEVHNGLGRLVAFGRCAAAAADVAADVAKPADAADAAGADQVLAQAA